MSDWIGMGATPRTPRPELKARVQAEAIHRGLKLSPAVRVLVVDSAAPAGPRIIQG